MSDANGLLLTQLHYYGRIGQWQKVRELAEAGLQRQAHHALLHLFRGFALLMQCSAQEAMRCLEQIVGDAELGLAARLATVDAHKLATNIDQEAVNELDEQCRQMKRANDAPLLYYGALYLFLHQEPAKASELVDKALKANAGHILAQCLKGWIELTPGRDMKVSKQMFDNAISQTSSSDQLDAYLGLCKYHEQRHNRNGMTEALNTASSLAPNFQPVYIERMKCHLMGKDWEHCAETATRCQVMDSTCVEAHKYLALHALCYEGNLQEAENSLAELQTALDASETNNQQLRLALAQLFARLSCRKQEILQITKQMVERCLAIRKTPEAQAELGRHLRMQGNAKQGIKAYKQALEMESTAPDVLLGIVHCYLLEGQLAEASAQVDFVKAAMSEQSVLLSYLEALIAKRSGQPRADVVPKLVAVADAQFASLQNIPYGADYFAALDPDFILDLVGQLLDYAPIEPSKNADDVVKEVQRILTVVTDAVPGLVDALYLLGKAKYLAAEGDAAQQVLNKCLAKDHTFSEGHLLMAQIYLQKNNFKMASQSLEVGLSYNFQVREHPLYHLIKARIHKRSHNTDAAVQQLLTAVNLPSFKAATEAGAEAAQRSVLGSAKLELSASDKVAIYLELIDCYQALGRTEEAGKWMAEALATFKGTQEEERLLLCNADLALARGDADAALAMLNLVAVDQPIYVQARQKIAEIYLHHKKDKRQFAVCYKELVDKNPTPQAFVLLGDAYMSIQEPERAIEVYEAALKRNPKDHELARKIGAAYVQAHLYTKAVAYYEASLKTGQQNFLRQDLADLLFRLQNYDKCEKVLKQGLEKQGTPIDVGSMIDEVKLLALLARLYLDTNKSAQAIDMLVQAKEQQARILKRSHAEIPDYAAQKALASRLCCELAEYSESKRDLAAAINYYKEALSYVDNDSKVMLQLANLNLAIGDVDECNHQCQVLLRIEKHNDAATLLLADLLYQRNEADSSIYHFQQLLDRNPNQYHGLARLVELSWRTGNLNLAERYLKLAVDRVSRATLDPGYNYCKGLYERHTGDPNAALQHFNRARRDAEWGERAIYNMIEICMNPDNEIIGGEVFHQGEAVDNTVGGRGGDQREVGARTAEKFLKEIRFKAGLDYKYQLMECFIQLNTKNRAQQEQTLDRLLEMAGGEGDQVTNVGAVLGVARAYLLLNQAPKAKTYLKKLMHHPWTLADADYLEQSWLLLADMYIGSSKYEQADELLKQCLQHNHSCLKAYEFCGYIAEKEQKFAASTVHYEHAFRIGRRRNPRLGYKLGYSQLKSKRLIDAIDTCHRVLELYPDYPKIRAEVLNKARLALRT